MESMLNEVLIEIFDYLKSRDLKNLLLTCKKFNSIISETAVLMSKLTMFIVNDFKVDGNRKYQNLNITFVRKNQSILSKQFNSLCENIVDLRIYIECNVINLKIINMLLSWTQNLKHLGLSGLKINDDFNGFDLSTLPRLELDSLTLFNCKSEITWKLLQFCSVKKLEIDLRLYKYRTSEEPLKNFLKGQTKLEHLILTKHYLSDFSYLFDEALIDVDFKLKTLELHLYVCNHANLENIKKFLQNQRNLHEVLIDMHNDNEPDLMNILSEIRHVKKLHLTGINFNFNQMRFIETLNLDQNLRNFDELFPNVKNLTIGYISNLKFVEQLTEPEATNRNEMIIPKVKNLELKFIDFKNENPFDYDDIKVEKLKLVECYNIYWLFEYLKTDGAKFNYLELKDMRITRNQQQYLESFTRGSNKKINELKIYLH